MSVKKQAATFAVKRTMHYITGDPEKRFPRLMKLARAVTRGRDPFYGRAIDLFDRMWNDAENPWHGYFINLLTRLNPNQREKFVLNFLLNDSIFGFSEQNRLSKELGCNVPWAILMDPTSACNLHCTGCWAAEYKKHDQLSFEEMDNVVRQGKKLSCYLYLYSGGEPMMRKADIIRLCEKHPDCEFAAFTNGTLLDEEFARNMERVGNFVPIISIEGFEADTDMRRGKGTFDRVVKAMDILKRHNLAFGFSCCYHSKNVQEVSGDEFIDFMIDKGAWFGWYFTFIPVGTDAPMELMVSAEQRASMYRRVNEIRNRKPIFVLDFWNDGEHSGGCLAGGRRYFHINAAGDAEPCAFIHYADSNIRDKSLLEILKSPLFMGYHDRQPFNDNMLRPCPLLDNPEKLREIVKKSGARSTQPLDPENVDDLTAKCEQAAQEWAGTSDELWKERSHIYEEKQAHSTIR